MIHGAGGRMGQRLVALATEDPQLKIVAALESKGHPDLGQDAGRVPASAPSAFPWPPTLEVEADCVLDFSVPEATGPDRRLLLSNVDSRWSWPRRD